MQNKQQAAEALAKQRKQTPPLSGLPRKQETTSPTIEGELLAPPIVPKGRETRVIVLEYPVDFAGEHYPSLSIRRLKAKDFRQMDYMAELGPNAQAIAMAALVCGVEEAVLDELDGADYVKVQEAIADFFPKALADKLPAKGSE